MKIECEKIQILADEKEEKHRMRSRRALGQYRFPVEEYKQMFPIVKTETFDDHFSDINDTVPDTLDDTYEGKDDFDIKEEFN